MQVDRTEHRQNVYSSKSTTEVSWFESEPTNSLEMIEGFLPNGGRVIDVGGGTSFLVDRLVKNKKWEFTVLDISSAALEHTRVRLGKLAQNVHWICSDVLQTNELTTYDIWHDRAVFHFLTQPDERQAYLKRLDNSLTAGGYFVVATFALDGPDKCSGLPVSRYDALGLQLVIGKGFQLKETLRVSHQTPTGKVQPFTFAAFQKV